VKGLVSHSEGGGKGENALRFPAMPRKNFTPDVNLKDGTQVFPSETFSSQLHFFPGHELETLKIAVLWTFARPAL